MCLKESIEDGIYQVLGGDCVFYQEVNTALEWDRIIRETLMPCTTLEHFKRALGVSNEVIAEMLGVDLNDLVKYQKSKGVLSPPIADRLYRSSKTYVQARAIFISESATHEWINTPHPVLKNCPPLDLLATEPGNLVVREMLSRIGNDSNA